MNKTISVVIPAYNRSNTIGRAIRSVVEQSFAVHEIIIVDDCSTDDTVQAALAAYPHCRIIRLKSNSGAQAARAAGVRAATGLWIAFLDSDDWWLPQKLEWQMGKTNDGYSVIHGPGLIRKGGIDSVFAIPPLEGNIYGRLLRQPGPLYQCLLVKRECFEKCGCPDPGICAYQEWDMSLMLARHYQFGFVDKPLFTYEVQEDSISNDNYRSFRGYEQIVCKWWKEIVSVAGLEAGVAHYQSLAMQASECSGIVGYLHYLRLAERLTGRHDLLKKGICNFILAAAKKSCKKIPYVEAIYRKLKNR